jgi:hypothetical protein
MTLVTGVFAVKFPLEVPAPVPWEHTVSQKTLTLSSGLEVTVIVIVSGWFAVPLASQSAKSPWALHEPIVPALAAIAVAATAPKASKPITARLATVRRNLRT